MNESTLVPREEMSDLDWLARNVHVWKGCDWSVLTRSYDCGLWLTKESCKDECLTKHQWLARRAELQNKPSWDDAPEWAEYMAQSPNGHWEFFAVKPRAEGWWRHPIAERSSANNASIRGAILGDWRDTLEKRPEGNIKSMSGVHSNGDMKELLYDLNDIDESIFGDGFMPKDATTANQAAITPSKYTKTIHGVSVDVYDVLQAWGVSNPALQHLIKKALQCGQRGHKDNAQDLQDIIDSAIRAKELGC